MYIEGYQLEEGRLGEEGEARRTKELDERSLRSPDDFIEVSVIQLDHVRRQYRHGHEGQEKGGEEGETHAGGRWEVEGRRKDALAVEL